MGNFMQNSHGADEAFRSIKKVLRNGADEVQKFGSEVSERAEEMATKIESRAKDYFQSGAEYVKEKPVRALAYVALGGALAGGLLTFFISRKMKNVSKTNQVSVRPEPRNAKRLKA